MASTKTQLRVLDQNTVGPRGFEQCGYHAFKNALLALMHLQGLINEEQFAALRNNAGLYRAVYQAIQMHHRNGDGDLSLQVFMKRLAQTKQGDFDFSAHGVSTADLQKLKLTFDGTQDISVINCGLTRHAAEYALNGLESDLAAAAAVVKLARTQGAASHVFVVGINNDQLGHWVTATLMQNERGERAWQVMDSYGNWSVYVDSVPAKIETILNKSKVQLKAYLLNVYTMANDHLQRAYIDQLNPFTGLPYEGSEAETLKMVQDNAYDILSWCETRLQFMRDTGWLENPEPEEKIKIQSLFQLVNFLNQNLNNPALNKRLQPMCTELNDALSKVKQEEKVGIRVAQNVPVVDASAPKNPPVVDTAVPQNPPVVDTIVPQNAPVIDTIVPQNAPVVDTSAAQQAKVDATPPPATPNRAPKANKPNNTTEETKDQPSAKPTPSTSQEKDDVKAQQQAAASAVKDGQPKRTEGIMARLIKGIQFLWEGLKNVVEHVARTIGVIS